MPSAVTNDQATVPSSPNPNARRASTKVLSRNIDNVVLGNLQFQAWYYSPYPDSLILDPDHQNLASGKHSSDGKTDHSRHVSPSSTNGHSKAESLKPPCPTLHVCPYCFRYTPNLKDYTVHLHLHLSAERQARDKADDGDEFMPVPESATKVYDWQGFSVWDVDGEVEKLYCQNLSLFGKLFLEQKSVFFDTSGFHYFILTYTSPGVDDYSTAKAESTGRGRKRRSGSSNEVEHGSSDMNGVKGKTGIQLRTQVVGFFSKENMSWDNNNLACILVFPPFQHRNLGQLLMTVSYKLSGWEWEDSIIGGPEKPLSAMGRKSYLRFWSERIARFMMGQSWDADGKVVFEDTITVGNAGAETGRRVGAGRKRKKAGVNFRTEELAVKEIGERTGMLVEDVVAALNEMGVWEITSPKKQKKVSSNSQNHDSGANGGDAGHEGGVAATQVDHEMTVTVSRQRILDWATSKQIDMVCPVKEEGFLGEWALSDVASVESEHSSQRSVDK